MSMTREADSATRTAAPTLKLDALVIGAGVAGLYQLHQLREQGLDVRAFDAAGDVGGTWYWNRYPGAKFDSEAYIYQYLFSEELYKEWSWSERFPGQPEIERWMQYVADKLDLRRSIQFSTTITSAHFNEATNRWTVRTDRGDVIDTQFLVTCAGMLSAPMEKVFPGQDGFQGPIFHTSRWPRDPVALAGKRVGVVGIGATGIQVIQTIASQVGQLKVFVRTPQYVLPMGNPKYGPDEVAAYKARFQEFQATLPNTFTGFEYDFKYVWADMTPAQRLAVLEDIHANGSLKLWLASFAKMFFDAAVNEEIPAFVRSKMRRRLEDPRLCEMLIPTDYGFDAGTGALTRIDIRGRGGRSLKEDWGRDIRTIMGPQIHGYPNLVTTAVPLAPSAALCNMTTCLQQQTEWISEFIRHLRGRGKAVIEPTRQAEDAWVAHHDETAGAMLISKTTSWYLGSNVPGKPRRVLSYTGGVGTYRQKCQEVAADGYAGFEMR